MENGSSIDQVKKNLKPMCLQPYTVPKVHKEIVLLRKRHNNWFYWDSLKIQMTENGDPHIPHSPSQKQTK